MAYTRQEQETSIVWDEESKKAKIYTASPVTMRKLDRLCEQYPNEYKQTMAEADGGKITAAKYEVPKGFIRFGKPKAMTDEQRKQVGERFARYKAKSSDK